MSQSLVLYTNPQSRGRIVRWMLEEVGAPYEVEVVAYGPPMKAPAFRAVNPMGKVPALTHRGMVVTECAAICAYLADAFPESGLAPALDSPLRGPYLRWFFFAAGPFEQASVNRAMGLKTPRDFEGMAGYGTLGAVLDTLEEALSGGENLLGQAFTAADLYLASLLAFATMRGMVETRPVFEAYSGRLLARPAAIRANEIEGGLPPAPS